MSIYPRNPPYYVGDPITLTDTITTPGTPGNPSTPIDPSDLTFMIKDPGGAVTTIGKASLTHVGTGIYSYVFDSTGGEPGVWTFQSIAPPGTGQGVGVDLFELQPQPI